MGTSNSDLYNWEMTGAPDEVTIATNPEAVADYNRYVEEVNAGQAEYGGGLPPQFIDNPVYEDPTYWASGKSAYTGGDGKTYYAENFLRPEEYLSMGYAAPFSAKELAAKVNKDNIRYGFQNTPYASIRGASDLSGGEYVVNPETGRFVLDDAGNPIPVPRERAKTGTFDSIMETAIPLFIAAASVPVLGGLGGQLFGTAGALGATGEAAAAASSLTGNAVLDAAIAGAAKGSATGAITNAITGENIIKGAVTGGVTGGVLGGGEAAFFPGAAELAKGSVLNAGLLGAARGAGGGALNTLLGNGDLKTNLLYGSVIGGTIGAGGEYFSPTSSANVANANDRFASVKDTLQNADQSLDYFGKLKVGEVSNMGYAGDPYSGIGINPATRTGGGYNVLDPEFITNRGGYNTGGYSGIGISPDIEQLYGGIGLNPNLNYNTTGLANTAEALSQASGVDINRAEFAGRGGLTADQEAALDRALTAADYPVSTNWFSGLGNLGTILGLSALNKSPGSPGSKTPGGGGGSFVPKGMVDYSGILNLLAPKTSTRSSLLG